MKKDINILYVDDEQANLNVFKAAFRRDYEIFTATSAREGMSVLENNPIQIIITDQRMPETTGVEFLASVIEKFPHPIRILLTGYADINAVIAAINLGQVYYYLSKPWDENQLRILIDKAFEVYTLREDKRILTEKLEIANQQLEFMLRQSLLS